MKIFITNTFKRTTKKLHQNQLISVKKAINKIVTNPSIGETKTGDLTGVKVYKFCMLHQQILLAYTHNEVAKKIILLALAPHENFYNKLKNQIKHEPALLQ